MESEKIQKILLQSGLPAAYVAWKKPPAMPYLLWEETATDNFYADGRVCLKIRHIQVELYTEKKDEMAEQKLENALMGYPWQKTSESWIESEKFFQTIYEFEV